MVVITLACLFVGDSTAQGAAQAFNRSAVAPCPVVARVGAASREVARWPLPATSARFAIVGIGSNDPANPALASNLWTRRQTLRAVRVVWLLPYDRRAAATVERVATRWGDYVLDLGQLPSRDNVHPTTYAGIATALRGLGLQ